MPRNIELIHMIISVLTISLAFSLAYLYISYASFISVFPLVLMTVGLGFILHELAHKFVAIHFGCVAVYRAWMEGLVLAVVMAIVTGGRLVFAAPGAVYIFKPNLTRKENGLISLAGPATNILLGIFFSFLLFIPGLQTVGMWGYRVNFFLALFNLVPIPPLDGSKVLGWKPLIWLAAIAIAGAGFFFEQAFLGTIFSLI